MKAVICVIPGLIRNPCALFGKSEGGYRVEPGMTFFVGMAFFVGMTKYQKYLTEIRVNARFFASWHLSKLKTWLIP